MDYAEISVDHKYHPHIIGKNGANGRCDISSLPNTLLLHASLCIRPPHVFANLLQWNLNITNPLRLGQRLLRVFFFTNTGTRLLYNEWEIFNTAQSRAWENLKVEAIWTRHSFYALIVVNTFRRFDVAG